MDHSNHIRGVLLEHWKRKGKMHGIIDGTIWLNFMVCGCCWQEQDAHMEKLAADAAAETAAEAKVLLMNSLISVTILKQSSYVGCHIGSAKFRFSLNLHGEFYMHMQFYDFAEFSLVQNVVFLFSPGQSRWWVGGNWWWFQEESGREKRRSSCAIGFENPRETHPRKGFQTQRETHPQSCSISNGGTKATNIDSS